MGWTPAFWESRMMKQPLWFYQTVQLCSAPTEGEKINMVFRYQHNKASGAAVQCQTFHS